jgi:dienelactone hydrolase
MVKERWSTVALAVVVSLELLGRASGQEGANQVPAGPPGETMIRAYLARLAAEAETRFPDDLRTASDWERLRPSYRDEYLYMLGLSPAPERTPLHARVTGTVGGDGFLVENLHYQSVPGLYVTANLYRPQRVRDGERLPAVLYVCGHSGMGRDGNKTAFQSHGIWLARNGFVALVVDTLQLGEIAGVHHGTYREGRWWWQSRGYTPAGVECWNGVRGLDYLVSRPDVDPDRLAVTGISGGGAATFWVAAADDRVKVAVPVSGMADLVSYVKDCVVDHHCDCMFVYNTFGWPWARIAGLVAPRPLLFVNSDHDPLFPIDADERVIARLERLYSKFGAGDQVDAVVSVGGHAYRRDIRAAAFRFLNAHLKSDARPVDDTEVDLSVESGPDRHFPIEPRTLRAFPTDADIPADQKNTTIDRHFVPLAKVDLPHAGEFAAWKSGLVRELRRVTFRPLPKRVPPGRVVEEKESGWVEMVTEPGIFVSVRLRDRAGEGTRRVVLVVSLDDGDALDDPRPEASRHDGDAVYRLQPRGVGPTRWDRKDPPNSVARSHALLGRTFALGQVHDVAAVSRALRKRHGDDVPVSVAGRGGAGLLAAYAALLEPDIDEVSLIDPPATHMDPSAPALLNVLRVLDVPEALGLLAPKPLRLSGAEEPVIARVAAIYAAAGAADKFDPRSKGR